jgi:hypothetical protein
MYAPFLREAQIKRCPFSQKKRSMCDKKFQKYDY